jgi:four helix bundle protein
MPRGEEGLVLSRGYGESCHFLGQATGSLLELETQLAIAVDLHFVAQAEFNSWNKKSSQVRR